MQNIIISPSILKDNVNFKVIFNLVKLSQEEVSEREKIIYNLFLLYHPKSEIFNLPEDEKLKILYEYDNNTKSILALSIAQEYKELIIATLLTPSERALLTLEKKLRELTLFIESTPYSLENVKLINDAMIAIDKLTDTIKNIREKLAIENEISSSSFLEEIYSQ